MAADKHRSSTLIGSLLPPLPLNIVSKPRSLSITLELTNDTVPLADKIANSSGEALSAQ